jgi:hypothetical protein
LDFILSNDIPAITTSVEDQFYRVDSTKISGIETIVSEGGFKEIGIPINLITVLDQYLLPEQFTAFQKTGLVKIN